MHWLSLKACIIADIVDVLCCSWKNTLRYSMGNAFPAFSAFLLVDDVPSIASSSPLDLASKSHGAALLKSTFFPNTCRQAY